MTTFYAIRAYDQESMSGDDVLGSYTLYRSFDKACDAIEREIHDGNFHRPDRAKMLQHLKTHNYVHYYEDEHCLLFVIVKMTEVEDVPTFSANECVPDVPNDGRVARDVDGVLWRYCAGDDVWVKV